MMDRYALYGEQTWEEIAKRVARGVASVDEDDWEYAYYKTIANREFVPGGRILAGAGGSDALTPYNCYVIPSPHDSREGIIENVGRMIQIMSRGGGVGVNLSSLRPRGAVVKKVHGFSSGPVSWADMYSTGTGSVIQGGSRRGALMLMLDDWHPDIEEFITVKQDMSRITNANLSVCVSDDFMEAVKNDAEWVLEYPDITDPDYDNLWDGDLRAWEYAGKPTIIHKLVRARDLWEKLCHAAWASGEPGLVFMERVNKEANSWYCETIRTTNPCGEQPLGAWNVCNLGALNLGAFYNPASTYKIDLGRLHDVTQIAIRFLDNVIDMADYSWLPETGEAQKDGLRRIGLGTMGLADLFLKAQVPYNSPFAEEITEKVFETIRDAAYRESVILSRQRGAFPKYQREKYLQGFFIRQLPEDLQHDIYTYGIRNAYLLTQAPTGSTSLVTGASSGIEPVFAFEYRREDRTGVHIVRHPEAEKWVQEHGEDVPLPDYFVSANDLTPEEHVRIQAIVQKYVDSSISKTVNAPHDHTEEQVQDLYMLAYDSGCKGVTYYRDGSRNEQVLYHNDDEVEDTQPVAVNKRPSRLDGFTEKLATPWGSLYITLNYQEGIPYEMFATIGKAGSDVTAFTEGLSRIISIALQHGVRLDVLSKQLTGIGGSSSIGFGINRVQSIPDAIGKFFYEVFTEGYKGHDIFTDEGEPIGYVEVAAQSGLMCPECGNGMIREEGCIKCYGCGYSEC